MHSDKIQKAICGAKDRPLIIGDIEIPAYVLEDGTRVLSRIGVIHAIGRKGKAKGGRKYDKESNIPVFLTAQNLKPFINNDLLRNSSPIKFNTGTNIAIGYKADLLPYICNVFMDAKEAGALTKNQMHIAERCKILSRGFAIVGINALIDEVTGYQEIRERRALAQILEKYIAKELQAWTKTFPDQFYREMFRLKSWSFDPNTIKRPSVIGRYTNDIVYERLAPGVLNELQRINPTIKKGQRARKHHQWLTGDIGHPKLKAHISGILALMRASATWRKFYNLVQRSYPKLNEQIPLALDVDDE